MKKRTEKQLANDERLRQAAQKRREEKNKEVLEDTPGEQSVDELKAQVKEMAQMMDLMKAAVLNQNQGVQMSRQGDLIGEFEKYVIDPANYPDPTPRLSAEARLKPLAFDYNYELSYEVGVSSYPTKTGKNIKEPKFMIQLNRIVLDEQGKQTPKRYIARKMIFHEDPDAALVIARENGIDVDRSDERLFLNEMRYLRVRDWLYNIFWPRPIDEDMNPIHDEVIGGTVVQVFTKSSQDTSNIEFDKLNSKL